MLLSLIVPIYNSEKYLKECLLSLLTQDINCDEYEIICVDDGSTDKSVEIVEQFRRKYCNIKLIKKSNGGVSSARNCGIANASGKYIWFIDSDDCIRANCLSDIKKMLTMYSPEFVLLRLQAVAEDYCFDRDIKEKLVYGVYESARSTFAVVTAIICSDIIKDNGINFSEQLKYGEDILFQYYVYIHRLNKMPTMYIENVIYFYRKHSESAMHHKNAKSFDRHVMDLIEMARIYQQDYKNRITTDTKKLDEIKMRQYMAVEGALTILPRSDLKYKDVLKMLKLEGLYPYPMLFWKVKEAKSMNEKINSFVKLLFKIEPLYKVYYIIRKFANR